MNEHRRILQAGKINVTRPALPVKQEEVKEVQDGNKKRKKRSR
jgi:hypothetical protein